MSTMENYVRSISALNDRMWSQAKPLEKQLREMEREYQSSSARPVTDVMARGAVAILATRMQQTAANLNMLYDEWRRNITLFTPPPPTVDPKAFPPPPSPGKISAKIPWPKDMPPDVTRYLSRVVDQSGIPLSKRVAISLAKAPYGGGGSVVVEFSKW